MAGLGTVGKAVVRLLQEKRARYEKEVGVSLQLVTILDRSYGRKDISWVKPGVQFTHSTEEFLESPADIVVELIGGSDPADEIITAGLQRHKSVVTANKLLMACQGERYLRLAAEHNTYLGFEACVAGGIPIIRILQRCLFSDHIVALRGILNGTCNFILSEMAKSGDSLEHILKQAQELGYAEVDPTLDLSGQDTRDKLTILSALSFGKWIRPEEVPTLGITAISPVDILYARKLNATLKLLGVADTNHDDITLRVSPFLVSNELPLSKISGVFNAVEVIGAMVGSTVFSGRGAGGDPTAVSVVADILNAALSVAQGGRFFPLQSPLQATVQTGLPSQSNRHPKSNNEVYPFYLRFFVKDQPGIIAALSGILAGEGINIDSVIQEKWHEPSNLPFIITVGPTPFSIIQRALAEMGKFPFNTTPPLALPILER